MIDKPYLLVISHVYPFPRQTGQEQRVYYTLKALRERFHITFLTAAPSGLVSEVREKLLEACDDAIVLPSRYCHHLATKLWHRAIGSTYTLFTGLKFSNYLIGQVEFSPSHLASVLNGKRYDLALFEYWHAVDSVSILHDKGIPCVLDMHNLLWKSYQRQLELRRIVPGWWKKRAIEQYKMREERAWNQFDGLIAINIAEYEYVRQKVLDQISVYYAPMGTDLSLWPYSWKPVNPPRLAYYGGLGGRHNQQAALLCVQQIMSTVWIHHPDAELWLVGSNPPDFLIALSKKDPRVRVTEYVEQVQEVLNTMTAVLCPWSGTYGFRSRLVEVMALGVPVVASPEAVYGMGMDEGQGIFLRESPEEMAATCTRLIDDHEFSKQQSGLARAQIESKFSFKTSYVRLTDQLFEFIYNPQGKSV